MKTSNLILLFLLLSGGCHTTLTGYPFKTLAIYEAPVSQLRITIDAEGFVPAGADVSEKSQGTVLIASMAESGKPVLLTFSDSDQLTYAIDGSEAGIAKWDWREANRSLVDILAAAEYPSPDENELSEIISIIGGAFGGPKTVLLDGQTEFLKVVEVDSAP